MSNGPFAAGPPSLSGGGEEPVFHQPWEAQAFAIVTKLHEAGYFTWPEWVDTLAAEIKAAQAGGDADLGDTYYRHWLAAAETLVQRKGLVTKSELRLRKLEVEANINKHVHEARREPLKIA